MELSKAKKIAEDLVRELTPYCDRIELAGSIRRGKPEVKDIEIVCIPKQKKEVDLFGDNAPKFGVNNPIPEFVSAVRKYPAEIGDPTGRYVKLLLSEIKVDLFIAFPNNWGFIFTLRTGSTWFNKDYLLIGLKNINHEAKDGFIYDKKGNLVELPEEIDLFNLINLKYLDPDRR